MIIKFILIHNCFKSISYWM